MKKYLMATLLTLILGASSSAFAYNPYANPNRVNVRGYYRSNGTYVQPHQRTAPNGTVRDNLGYRW